MKSTAKQGASAKRGLFRIGDVARLVGISPSALRTWEKLGLVEPVRTDSQYRMYTADDVRLLKRAKFLRRTRGLNPAAIAHLLKTEGAIKSKRSKHRNSVGPVLRRFRLQKKLSLAEVAVSTGVSTGFLSALERDQMSASVSTLSRLAKFYQTNVLAFFNPREVNPYLVKPSQRKVLIPTEGVRMELLAWGNTIMEPHLFRIAPGAGSGNSYTHDGEEFLYVLRGQLNISLDGAQNFRLKAGDSFYFESTTPHEWSNPGKTEAWIVWVNTPASF